MPHALWTLLPFLTADIDGWRAADDERHVFRAEAHAVYIHADGSAREALTPAEIAASGEVVGRRLSHLEGERQLGRLMDAVRRSDRDTIVIYVHGGRISYEKGRERVLARGAALDSAGYYPIFINWNSSGLSSLWWHLFRMRQGLDWGPVRGTLSAPFMVVGAVGRGVSRAPFNAMQQLADYCRVLGGMGRGGVDGRIEGSRFCPIPGVDQARREQALFEQELVTQPMATAEEAPLPIGVGAYNRSKREGAVRIASGVVTFAPKLVLGPIADGFGAGTWSEMRRRASTMIHPRRDLTRRDDVHTAYRSPTGVVHALVDSLSALIAAQGADSVPPERRRSRRLILAGHSMGTIVLDEVLMHFPELPVSRIIYLAPATTVAGLENSVVRFLERHPDALYYHGMLHPYADAGEWQPGMLDLVPRGSLLEWVDDFLSIPDTPFDRVSGKWENIASATQIFTPAVRDRVIVKSFGVQDPFDRHDPILYRHLDHHAGFSNPDFAFWDEKKWQLRPHALPSGRVRVAGPPGQRSERARAGGAH